MQENEQLGVLVTYRRGNPRQVFTPVPNGLGGEAADIWLYRLVSEAAVDPKVKSVDVVRRQVS